MSESNLPNPDRQYILTLRSAQDKYYVERATAVFFVLLSLGLSYVSFMMYGSMFRRAPANDIGFCILLFLLLASLTLLPAVLGIRTWIIAQQENKLLSGDQEPAFVIDDRGVSGSIVMLEGSQRSKLRKGGLARFSLKWNDIGEIRFVAGRRISMMTIIPCAGLQGEATYIVTRNNFIGKEKSIVEILQKHGAEVVVEDRLH